MTMKQMEQKIDRLEENLNKLNETVKSKNKIVPCKETNQIEKLYLTWNDIEIHTLNLSHHILNYFSEVNLPDMLISLGRGGMCLTRLISETCKIPIVRFFDIKCYTADDKITDVSYGSFNYKELENKEVVLIDDVYTTGTTIKTVNDLIHKHVKNVSVSCATLYWNVDLLKSNGTAKRPDVYSGTYNARNTWLVFPWETIGETFQNYKDSWYTGSR